MGVLICLLVTSRASPLPATSSETHRLEYNHNQYFNTFRICYIDKEPYFS